MVDARVTNRVGLACIVTGLEVTVDVGDSVSVGASAVGSLVAGSPVAGSLVAVGSAGSSPPSVTDIVGVSGTNGSVGSGGRVGVIWLGRLHASVVTNSSVPTEKSILRIKCSLIQPCEVSKSFELLRLIAE